MRSYTPLPEHLSEDEAISNANQYFQFHVRYFREVRLRVTPEELNHIQKEALRCELFLEKIAHAIHDEHKAKIQFFADQEWHKAKIFKRLFIAFAIFWVVAGEFIFERSELENILFLYTLGLVWFYRHYVGTKTLMASERELDNRTRELKSVFLDFKIACPAYRGFSQQTLDMLATVLMFSRKSDGRMKITTQGMIDSMLLPKYVPENFDIYAKIDLDIYEKTRSTNLDKISLYGANFEDYRDPRVTVKLHEVIKHKIFIANVPYKIREIIDSQLEKELPFVPSEFWDYADYIRDLNDSAAVHTE